MTSKMTSAIKHGRSSLFTFESIVFFAIYSTSNPVIVKNK